MFNLLFHADYQLRLYLFNYLFILYFENVCHCSLWSFTQGYSKSEGGKKEKDFHMLDLGIEYVSQPVREATQGQWDEN